jgi:hypothetical protein
MSRASSGTVAEAVATCTAECFPCPNPCPPDVGGLVVVGTVGKRPAGFVVDDALGIGGSDVGGTAVLGVVGLTLGFRTTL